MDEPFLHAPRVSTPQRPAGDEAGLDASRTREYLELHARNLESEVARLRRDRRALVARLHEAEHRERYWKGLYQAVVSSWSWRAAWTLLTPYRAWLAVRERRVQSAAPRLP